MFNFNQIKKMKRLNYFVCAAFAIAAAVACDPVEEGPKDFPIVGEFSLYGELAPATQVGVYVTSDGIEQSNLLYTAAEGEGAVELQAGDVKAGFKQGDHVIYAYAPYAEEVSDLTVIPMPDLANQSLDSLEVPDWAAEMGEAGLAYASKKTSFVEFKIAKTEVAEYSLSAITLPFDSPVKTRTIGFGEITFGGEGVDALVGKKITKIVVSSDEVLGYTAGTYDFVESKGNYTEVKSMILNCEIEISKLSFVVGKPIIFATTLSEEKEPETKYTVEVYLSDGTKYVAEEYMMGKWGYGAVEVVLAE